MASEMGMSMMINIMKSKKENAYNCKFHFLLKTQMKYEDGQAHNFKFDFSKTFRGLKASHGLYINNESFTPG